MRGIDYYDGLLYLREELRSFMGPNTPDSLALSGHQAIRDPVEMGVSAENHGVIPSGALALSVYNTPRRGRMTDVVYVIVCSEGTCPSDHMEWPVQAFASRADADAFVEANPFEPNEGMGGVGYEVVEVPLA